MLLKESNFSREDIRLDVNEIVREHRDYEASLINQITEKTEILLFSDLEGPFQIGDTAMEVMKRFIPGGMGGEYYNASYNWYDPCYYKTGLGQEAGDIILALPFLLAYGVTGEDIAGIAAGSGKMKGSDKVIEAVKKEKG
jgi:predicted HAD superfamily phosphohydrolase